MHNKEKNGVTVTTVTSNKVSKERGKNTMENKKTSLNIRKLKKQDKGITLIALVVTINCQKNFRLSMVKTQLRCYNKNIDKEE